MIWQNPWALLGLGAIAVPILIHLLGRDKAPRHAFPSLRFIEIAELPPTRRTRLHDLLLLATRVAIIAVAAAALAQPLLLFASRRARIDSRLARTIVVDTSASMRRETIGGGPAIDSARQQAKRLASDAQTSVIVETSSLRSAIDGAVAWLESQPSRRELVLVSDFQTGAIDSATVAEVPSPIGVRAVPIAVRTDRALLERHALVRSASVVARIDVASNPTSVSWTLGAAGVPPSVRVDAEDRRSAEVISAAASTVAVPSPVDTTAGVTVVFAGAADRDALHKRSIRVTSSRLLALISRIGFDSLAVAEDTTTGSHRLLVFSNDSAATLRSARLLGEIRRALSVAPEVSELDPSTTAATAIASWQRAPSTTPTRETVDSATGPSDGRWLWVLVLVLIVGETWLRRERRAAAIRIEERAGERAA